GGVGISIVLVDYVSGVEGVRNGIEFYIFQNFQPRSTINGNRKPHIRLVPVQVFQGACDGLASADLEVYESERVGGYGFVNFPIPDFAVVSGKYFKGNEYGLIAYGLTRLAITYHGLVVYGGRWLRESSQ